MYNNIKLEKGLYSITGIVRMSDDKIEKLKASMNALGLIK